MIATAVQFYFGSLPDPEPGVAIIGGDGQIVIFNGMLAFCMDNTARVVYVCSVCDKAFGDIHSSCAKHVNGRGACKAKGAVVLQLPINFSSNDRSVGGRLGLQHGFGQLAAPGQAGDSDMEAGRPPSPAQAPLSGIHTYPIYLSLLILKTYPNLSQLS